MDIVEERRAAAGKIPYTSVFAGHEECRWSNWKNLPAEEMLPHVREVVFPFIKKLSNGEKSRFSEQMKDAVFIIAKPSLLQEAVSIFDRINITTGKQKTPQIEKENASLFRLMR